MGDKLTNQQKKDWAKLLYTKEQLTQKEIAERVGVSAVTINKWVKDGKWDDLKVSLTITKEEQLKNLYRLLANLNEEIASRDGNNYPTSAESDTIAKLSNSIKSLEVDTGLSDILAAFKDFLSWLRRTDLAEAQRIVPLFDDFVKTKLK